VLFGVQARRSAWDDLTTWASDIASLSPRSRPIRLERAKNARTDPTRESQITGGPERSGCALI
jgi:hypothetical protein